MLSNAYFLAKFRFDTAENEPAKNLLNFADFPNFANPNPNSSSVRATRGASGGVPAGLVFSLPVVCRGKAPRFAFFSDGFRRGC